MNTELSSPNETRATGNTPLVQIFQKMFPKGMVRSQEGDATANSCMANESCDVHVLLSKAKSIPVDGNMLATVSTIDMAGRSRWFLMECGDVYVVIKMSPAKAGSAHAEVVSCLGAAVTEGEKFYWRQHFQKNVANLNAGSSN